jgi:hypothetical protein
MQAAALAAIFLAGCGGLDIPKATPLDELPRPAALLERAPEFSVTRRDGSVVGPGDLEGSPAVLIGFDWRFVSDALEWKAKIAGRFGPPGERYAMLLVVEDRRIGMLDKLRSLTPAAAGFFAAHDLGIRFGFASEGPHLIVIAPDAALLAAVDGTPTLRRFEEVAFALQGVLPPVAGE